LRNIGYSLNKNATFAKNQLNWHFCIYPNL